MPTNLQRLSACMSAILAGLECPVCLETISPPACQCVNGHLLCIRCHAKSERCPVCRIRLSRGRCLFGDQVYNAMLEAFELTKIPDEKVRSAKMQQIVKPSKKKKDVPDIKVTQSHADKFLARLVEKSSSAENLCNQSLMPRAFLAVHGDGHFQSNLKTKSLSTSEIFRPASPGVARLENGSRSSLISRTNASCHGSAESLNDSRDDSLYNCPFDSECAQLFKGHAIMKHFREMHAGPLIQYFKTDATFNLLDGHPDTYCFVNDDDKHFFLRIHAVSDDSSSKNDLFVWMWLLGDQREASEYLLQIQVSYSKDPGRTLLSSNCPVFSLTNVSWKKAVETKKAIYLSSETLNVLNNNSLQNGHLMLYIKLSKNNR